MKKIALAVGILMMFTAPIVQAQTREGPWIGLDLGVGSFGRDGRADVAVPVWHAGIGGYIAERVLLALEAGFWSHQTASSVKQYTVGPIAYIYPSRSGGLFFKVGVGVGGAAQPLDLSYSIDSLSGRDGTGLALSVGLGVEIAIGEFMALRPFINAGRGSSWRPWTLKEIGVGVSFP